MSKRTEHDREINRLVSEALAQSRADAGKTQQEMADHLDVKLQTVQNWEYNVSEPKFLYVYKWFEFLELNMYVYLGNDKNTVDKIASLASTLDEDYQKQLELLLADSRREAYLRIYGYSKKIWVENMRKSMS